MINPVKKFLTQNSVEHIVCGYSKLAQRNYKKRHHTHTTGLFIGKFVKFMISHILASCTSIIGTTTVFIIDIAIPGDGNVESKGRKRNRKNIKTKQGKYLDFGRRRQK